MPILGLFRPARAAGAAIGYLNSPVHNDFSRSCRWWLWPSGLALADVHHHFRVMFRPNNTNWSSRSAEAAAIVQDTRQEKTRFARMLTVSRSRSLATSSADENVASRAYFDGASSSAAFTACRSQYVHVDGTSRLDASRRSTPSEVTSAVGAVRATGRRGAAGGIAGGGWCRRSLCPRCRGGQSPFPFPTAISSTKLREKKK